MDISALKKFLENGSVTRGDFYTGFKNVQQEGNYNTGSIFSNQYSDLQLRNIFTVFDINGDGVIDKADKLNDKSVKDSVISEEDLALLVEEFNEMLANGKMGINDGFLGLSQMLSQAGSSRHSSSHSSSSSSTPNADSGTQQPASNDYSSMSVEDLQSKLSDAQGTLTTNQDALNRIINGTNPTLQGLQQNIDTAEEKFQETLNKVAPELAEQYKTAKDNLDTHNQAVADKQVAVNEKQSTVDSLTSEISSLDGQISSYESAIADLKAAQGQENAPADLASRISDAESKKSALEEQKRQKESELQTANKDLTKLQGELSDLEALTTEKQQAVETIDKQITELNNTELNTLKGEVTKAQSEYDTQKTSLMTEAEKAVNTSKMEVNNIQSELDVKQAKQIQKDNAVYDTKNVEKLFNDLGLKEQGLNFEVFKLAMEGYNNLEDKGNGMLGIFDTTQSADKERYYLLDLNNFELVGRTVLKTGSGNMNNIKTANKDGSHATLSGFEKVGDEYYSDSMGKQAMRLIGLEQGINDQALNKGTVVHYTVNNSTWGCKGFTPVMKNGHVDVAATNQKMYKLFPKGTIIFTNPTDSRYRELSSLVA